MNLQNRALNTTCHGYKTKDKSRGFVQHVVYDRHCVPAAHLLFGNLDADKPQRTQTASTQEHEPDFGQAAGEYFNKALSEREYIHLSYKRQSEAGAFRPDRTLYPETAYEYRRPHLFNLCRQERSHRAGGKSYEHCKEEQIQGYSGYGTGVAGLKFNRKRQISALQNGSD